jgi:O-antigen ligase
LIAVQTNKNFLTGIFVALFILCVGIATATQQYVVAGIPFAALFLYMGWQRPELVFLLLLCSLPFSMEYQVTGSLATDFPDELLMLLVSGLFIFYVLYRPGALPAKLWQHPLLLLVLAGFGWAMLSSCFSTMPLLSLKFLLAKTWFFGAFILAPLVLFREKQMIQRSIGVLAIAMFAVTLIALIRHYSLGFTFASINDALQPFFRNHVNYSSMLVCIIPAVFLYMRTTTKKRSGTMAGIVLAILLLALFLSYARGAWLALLAGIMVAWLIKRKLLVTVYTIAITGLLVLFFWIKTDDRYLDFAHDYRTTIWHEDFSEHLAATYQLKDVSTAERFYRWIAGVRMIKDKSLTGYGPNSFYYNYRPYTVPAFKTWVSNNAEHSTVHNYFLLLAIEQGVPGLLLFLLLTAAMLYYAQMLYHRATDRFYKNVAITTGTVIAMILTVNFLSDLIETDKIGSLFFLCISLLVITDINTRDKRKAGSKKQ